MKIRLNANRAETTQVSHDILYDVYWIECLDDITVYGICSNEYENMRFPITVRAEESTIVDPSINPLWVVAFEFGEPHSLSMAKATLLIAHPLHIAEEKKSSEKHGYFGERMSNDDAEALAVWVQIKAEMDGEKAH